MKRILLILLLTGTALAEGARYDSTVLNRDARPVGAATIRVCADGAANIAPGDGINCFPLATIYTTESLATSAPNPITADSFANFGFWAASGTVNLEITGPGLGTFNYPVTLPLNFKADPVKKCLDCAGDGVVLSDGAITASTSTLTSALASFTSADVGKPVSVEGAGAAGVALNTTIASFVSATSVTLTVAASTTVSGATVLYGTDDSTEIQAVLDALSTAKGGTLMLKGTSVITTAITLKSGGVALVGAGTGSAAALSTFGYRGTRLLVLGGIYGVIVSDSTTQVQRGFTVENLTIIGTSLGKAGLRMGSTSSDVNNQFSSASVSRVQIEGFTSSTVSHDVPSGEPAATGGAGIFITRGVDVQFGSVVARKNYRGLLESSDHAATTYGFSRSNFRESTNVGVELRDSISFHFDDCIFESNGAEGLKVITAGAAFVNFLQVTNSYFEDNVKTSGTHEILLDGTAGGIFNFSFKNNNLNTGTVATAKGFKATGANVEVGYIENTSLQHPSNTNIETVTTGGKILVIDVPSDSNPGHGPNVLEAGTMVISPSVGMTSPAFISTASDPADAGLIRGGNADQWCLEASPAGTDVCLSLDSPNEHLKLVGASEGTLLANDTGGNRQWALSSNLLQFSGSSAGAPTIDFNITDPTSPRSVTVPDAGGHLPILPTAATTESGSGAIVRQTSATVITPTINTGVSQGTGAKHGRVTTGSCATTGCQVTLTWGGSAFANTSYTPVCSVEDSTAQSETTGLRFAKISSKTTTTVVVDIDNFSGAGVTGTVHCQAFHD